MRTFLLTSLILLSGGAAWAMDISSATRAQEAKEREQRSNVYQIKESTDRACFVNLSDDGQDVIAIYTNHEIEAMPGGKAFVVFDSSATSLDDFIASGKFCAIYGHRWDFGVENYEVISFCTYCKHRRHRVKVEKESEEWEP